jgi:hypothetical protein
MRRIRTVKIPSHPLTPFEITENSRCRSRKSRKRQRNGIKIPPSSDFSDKFPKIALERGRKYYDY